MRVFLISAAVMAIAAMLNTFTAGIYFALEKNELVAINLCAALIFFIASMICVAQLRKSR